MRLKIILISLALSLPFWWGVNVLEKNLEQVWLWQEMAKSPELLTAQVNIDLLQARKVDRVDRDKVEPEVVESEPEPVVQDTVIRAKAAIAVEIDNTGRREVLYQKNSSSPLPIASITKLMTALVVLDLNSTYTSSQLIRISQNAVDQEGTSKYGKLELGESFSVENLLHVILIESSNDAAYAITEVIGHNAFVELMNLKAKKIGLENTAFINPTGLEPNELAGVKNYSTPEDLVDLVNYIYLNYPKILDITAKSTYSVLNPDQTVHHVIPRSTNVLLGEIPGIIGGKTGWSPVSQGCLLIVLNKDDGYSVNVVLGARDRFAEMRKLIKNTDQ